MAEPESPDRDSTNSPDRRPRVRSPRLVRTLVMCALAAAPAACGGGNGGGSQEPEPGRVYRGGPDASGPEDPVTTPDYGIEPRPAPSPDDAVAVPAYGVYPPPPPAPPPLPDDGPATAVEYGVPAPEPEPVLMYAMPHR